jgi:PAS domain S-box-containing protein
LTSTEPLSSIEHGFGMTNLAPQLTGRDTWDPLLSAPADGHHLVHFYEDEEALFDVVGGFLGAGLDAHDRLVVIATPEHRSTLVQRLRDREGDRAVATGQLLLLDAREMLARFMVNGQPDPERFQLVLEQALTRVGAGVAGARVRAYGEMVDLLWRDGERSAAIALEELWNEAGSRHAFSLLRAYVIANFYKGAGAGNYADVCRSHVVPARSISMSTNIPSVRGLLAGDVEAPEISQLRQRLRIAELENGRLREMERAVRESAWEQRRAHQEALLASEARFHHLVDAVTDYAIFMLDSAGRVATWNPGVLKIKGYRREEILGQHFSVFYTAEDRAAAKPERILDTVRREGRFEDESWRVRKDGSRFWANVVISALRGPNGEITGFAKVTRDLSARREAEERERELAREQSARAESEKASRELERLNRVGALFIADPSKLEAILLEIVDTSIEISGADFGNIQLVQPNGTDLRIAAQRGFPQWWLDFWNQVSAGQGSCGMTLAQGRRVVVEDVERSPIFVGTPALDIQRRAGVRAVVSVPIVSRSGRALGIFSTHYRVPHVPEVRTLQMLDVLARQTADILDRARADATDAATRRDLEQANRAKDEFVATLSHELRTPLNAMLGWATMLVRDSSDPVRLRRGLEVIERNAKAQTRLVNDLLDVSRIINGKLRLSMKRTEVSAVIQAAADVVRPAANAKGVHLVLDLDATTTVADPERLQQIVWNLLSNAVRFTPSGGRVTVTARRDGSRISICVQDTGSGIPPAHLPHIFERFRQVDSSTTRAHGGLGLGLAIVRHLVEAHGGSVFAASEGLGRGATFSVHLPIPAVNIPEAPPLSEPSTEAEPAISARLPAELRNVRALVVDDDADSLELVRLVLESAGTEVTTVTSASAALAARGPFDVVISDIGMPGVDGYAFMKRLRSSDLGGTIPAIALTAYARPEDADRAARAGYQEHFAKPVDASALIEAVARWTERKRDRPAALLGA